MSAGGGDTPHSVLFKCCVDRSGTEPYALGFAAARALALDDQQRAFALTTAGFGVGQIAGPVMAGLLLDRTGSFAAPSLLAAGALLLAAWLINRVAPRAQVTG